MSLARVTRNIAFCRSSALEAVVRGPKKKKGGAGGPAEVASDDVVNIFKERTDPEMMPINHYPLWMSHLLLPQMRFEEAIEIYMADEELLKPHTRDLKRLMNQMRRFNIYEQNYTKTVKSTSLDYTITAREQKDLFSQSKDEQEEETAAEGEGEDGDDSD